MKINEIIDHWVTARKDDMFLCRTSVGETPIRWENRRSRAWMVEDHRTLDCRRLYPDEYAEFVLMARRYLGVQTELI